MILLFFSVIVIVKTSLIPSRVSVVVSQVNISISSFFIMMLYQIKIKMGIKKRDALHGFHGLKGLSMKFFVICRGWKVMHKSPLPYVKISIISKVISF